MKRWGALLGGLAVIVLVNAVILGGVAWNRSGAPEARVELTERELDFSRNFDPEEDSGLSLRLGWSGDSDWSGQDWLDREKLRELGFDVRVDPADPKAVKLYERVLAREAFVVLQMEGEAWRRWIAEQERNLQELKKPETDRWQIEVARDRLEADRHMGSRLVPVDAGLDPQALRTRYPDRARYLILPATFDLQYTPGGRDHPARLFGILRGLLVEEVHAPLELRPVLDAVRRQRDWERQRPDGKVKETPLYRATIAIGRRYEPRLERVEPITP